MSGPLDRVASKTFRTGVQTLWCSRGGQYFVSIRNRTYASIVPIPREKARVWLALLSDKAKEIPNPSLAR